MANASEWVQSIEHTLPKKTRYGTIERSLGQDKVYCKNETGQWKHCGFLFHAHRGFQGLVDFPHELGADLCKELAKIKGYPVAFLGAPESVPEFVEVDESEDEDE